ncbi:hypothetical protein E0I61_15575 [Flavobacterium ranwuense]|uniref:Uncharacterized protein n=1 Tax=Flavobacterium ranwuense TaxID=2541725 RepID=A0ABY2DMQ2_9FLAO|nr:hypothetical protein [Flavobacterium ranwuense]TDE27065.1 hypothetical protein E0I61_15575 [Flavobacterium ranwuense]
MNLSNNITLEIFEEYDEVTYYTFRFLGDEFSEAEKFILNFIDKKEFEEDLGIITKMIEKIGKSGAEPRNFRNVGKMRDDVASLPEYLYSSKLRLYVIHISKNIVIIGNGGYKTTKTYNEDPFLDSCVSLLQTIDFKIKSNIKYNRLSIINRKLVGNLSYNI